MMELPFIKTVTRHKFAPIYNEDGSLSFRSVAHVLFLDNSEIAKILNVRTDSIRFDKRMTGSQRELLIKCACAIDHVSEYFNGDFTKVRTWLHFANPQTQMLTPVQLIMSGPTGIDKLLKIIIEAQR